MRTGTLIRLQRALTLAVIEEAPHFVLPGRLIMKKNNIKPIVLKGIGRAAIAYTSTWKKFERTAVPCLESQRVKTACPWRRGDAKASFPLAFPVHVVVRYHLDGGNYPDLLEVTHTIGDLLEAAGILDNDGWIASTDGSRILCDPTEAKTDIWIVPHVVQLGEQYPKPKKKPKGAAKKRTARPKKPRKRKKAK